MPAANRIYKGESYMPVIKVRENEPFDVALRRFTNVSALKLLQWNVTRRNWLAKTHAVLVCT